jgi:hypothetical protein
MKGFFCTIKIFIKGFSISTYSYESRHAVQLFLLGKVWRKNTHYKMELLGVGKISSIYMPGKLACFILYYVLYPSTLPNTMIFNSYTSKPLFRHEFSIFFKNSHMNQSETLIAETTFSFSELKKNVTGVIENKTFRFERTRTDSVKTINNYLKTPEEMDAEFCLEMNMNKLMMKEYAGIFDTYGRIIKNKDGNTNTYSPDDTPSGFMEENY